MAIVLGPLHLQAEQEESAVSDFCWYLLLLQQRAKLSCFCSKNGGQKLKVIGAKMPGIPPTIWEKNRGHFAVRTLLHVELHVRAKLAFNIFQLARISIADRHVLLQHISTDESPQC